MLVIELSTSQFFRCYPSGMITSTWLVTRVMAYPAAVRHSVAIFNQLHDQAIYGHDARQLVAKVLASL